MHLAEVKWIQGRKRGQQRCVITWHFTALVLLLPPLTAHYQRASPPSTASDRRPLPPSVSEHDLLLILHSQFFLFFFFFCCCEVLTSNRAGHYPGAEGDYWCLATSEETVMETKTGSEGRAWQERRAACMCVFSPPFSSSRVKVLISVAGTVPASPICHAALSARQNERKER